MNFLNRQPAGFQAPSLVAPPPGTDPLLLERTCRLALWGVSRLVAALAAVAGLLFVVALVLLVGENRALGQVAFNLSAAVVMLALVVAALDMATAGGYFKRERASAVMVGVGVALVIAAWALHNPAGKDVHWGYSAPLLALAILSLVALRQRQARIPDAFILKGETLPGYMRPYRGFVMQIDRQIDNALFANPRQLSPETLQNAADQYAEVKAALDQVTRRQSDQAQAERSVKDYLRAANALLSQLTLSGSVAPEAASTASLARLASMNLERLVRM
jgi:hypothetical protein